MTKRLYPRTLHFSKYLRHKSLFLLGPRQTGKSSLLKVLYPNALSIDLLESETYRVLSRAPETLREYLSHSSELLIIDEVQKLPSLLDEVQLIIDRNPKMRIILTGSSARKLKRGQSNLLGGRALFFELFPLTSQELGFGRWRDQVQKGSLPAIIDSPIAWEELKAYVGVYLREEIQAEGLSRSLENFSRFLDFSANFNAELMNYTKLGNDAQVSPRTIKDYVKILEDTLVASTLPPLKTTGRKTVSAHKFYLFDCGVTNLLLGQKNIKPGTAAYGKIFEQLIFLELKAYLSYYRRDEELSYWRTQSQNEVDFVTSNKQGTHFAIEAKASENITHSDSKNLIRLSQDIKIQRSFIVSREKRKRIMDQKVEIYPIELFLEELWSHKIF